MLRPSCYLLEMESNDSICDEDTFISAYSTDGVSAWGREVRWSVRRTIMGRVDLRCAWS